MIILEAGDVFAGRFRLEEKIGQGGMGQVWRATQLGLNRQVAVKIILPNVHGDLRFRRAQRTSRPSSRSTRWTSRNPFARDGQM